MKRLAVVLVALAALGAGWAWKAHAAVTLHPCAGAPAAYVVAFDTLDGSKNGAVSYPYWTWYDEKQTWATPDGVAPGHHSEHIHMGACLPNGQTLTETTPWKRVDVMYVFHNVADYKVTQAARSAVTIPGSTALYIATSAQLAQLQAGMDASSAGAVVNVFQSYPVIPPTYNGPKELRGGIDVAADGPTAIFQTWGLDSRNYYTDNYAGLPNPGRQAGGYPNQMSVRLRSITSGVNTITGQTFHDYHHSGWMESNIQPSDVIRYWANGQKANLRVSDGGGPALLMVDPDFHHHYAPGDPGCTNVDANGNCLGVWFKDLGRTQTWPVAPCGCAYALSVPVPTTGLTPGWHKLVFLSNDSQAGRGTWTNVTVRPIRIKAP